MSEKPLEEIVFLVEEAPEGGYTARALGASIVTEADDLEGLRRQVVEAVHCHFAGAAQQPRLIRLHLVKDEVLTA
ncbi:MAG: 2-oxoisovalerate dehydrogenase [Candidatus Omnitrophica bacterium]|nr:2-oxoisovalerate dehydrogenase [Candidatus Omnitrophota bacterium]